MSNVKVEKQEPVAYRIETGYSQPFYMYSNTLPSRGKWDALYTAPQPCPECEKLKAERDELAAQVTHWKANHASVVEQARILKERPDMPIERVKAYENWVAMAAQNQQMLEAIENVKEEAWRCCSHQRASRLCEALALPNLTTSALNKVRAEALRKAVDLIIDLGDDSSTLDARTLTAAAQHLRALAADMEAGKC